MACCHRMQKKRAARPASIKPLPSRTACALAVLFLSGLAAFISTLPLVQAENIFRVTSSRLHTAGGVLLTRLAAVRAVTERDEQLRHLFDRGGLEARLLYARYGPDVVLDAWTLGAAGDIDAGRNFLLYALPSLLAPHLLHLCALGLATSRLLSGRDGARWRTVAVIAGLTVAVAELGCIAFYDDTPNLQSVRVNDVDFVFWKMAVWRGLAIAATDGVLGWVIWLQATGRAFLSPVPAGERIAAVTKEFETALEKVQALGVIRNGTVRDQQSRRRVEEYWTRESEIIKDAMEQPEVLTAQRNALAKGDAEKTTREAEAFVDRFLRAIPPPPAAT